MRLYDDVRTPGELTSSVLGPVADTSHPNWVADPDGPGFTDLTGSHAMTLSGDVQQGWSAGNDALLGGSVTDTIYGGGGNDFIDDEAGSRCEHHVLGPGSDTISAGGGADFVSGGEDDDTLFGEDGDDTLTGGDSDDVFVYNVADGANTITDFNTGNSRALGDGNVENNDFIDLESFYGNLNELREDFNDDGVLNQSNSIANGGTVDYSANAQMQSGDGLTFDGADQSSFTADNTGVACFISGTAIRTPHGDGLIHDLTVGDLVNTMDDGRQKICWIGKRHVSYAELKRNNRLYPVLINKGALGTKRDLLVSGQHGMLLGQDHLSRAVHLVKTMPGIRITAGKRQVTTSI